MSNYSSLKSAIDANIKANGRREITGPVLNAILNAVVNSLGDGYLFRGVAIPSTNPGTPDQNVAYLAITEGTYTHMGGLSVTDGELSVFSYNGAWSKIPLALVPTKTSQLDNDLRFVTSEEMGESLSSKQDNIQDLSEIRSGAALGATAYQKPSAGIPSSDMTDTVQQAISFAESTEKRSYNSSNPDGMGYLVLKKNKTFAEQVTQANTIYEIRDNFNLNGGSVNIPAGCILKFNGGVIGNGTIVGNGTSIDAAIAKIFDSTISISGTWDVDHAFVEWFGAVGDGVSDDLSFVQNCFSSPFKRIRLINSYYISNTINITSDKVVDGGGTLISPSSSSKRGLLHFSNCQNAIVDGLSFRSTRDNVSIPPAGHTRADGSVSSNIYFLYFTNVDNAEVYNCKYENSEIDILCGSCVSIFEDGFVSKNASCHLNSVDTNKVVSKNGNIELYNLLGSGDHSYYLQTNLKDALIENCKMIDESGLTQYQVHIYGGSGETLAQNVVVKDCYIKASTMVYANCENLGVSNVEMVFVSSQYPANIIGTSLTTNEIVFRNCHIVKESGPSAIMGNSAASCVFEGCVFDANIENQLTSGNNAFVSCIFNGAFLRNRTTKDQYTSCTFNGTITFNVVSQTDFFQCAFRARTTYSGAGTTHYYNCDFSADSLYLIYTNVATNLTFDGCSFLGDYADGIFRFQNDNANIKFNNCQGENKNSSHYLEYNASSKPSVSFFGCSFPTTKVRHTSNPNYSFLYSQFLDNYVGYIKYDATLGKCVVWNGTAWVNVDGTALA